ncbi:PREDICTED: jasmonic acid-amido synthetase JAR1-like [Tarenaya hassleriana]|uniref:jasmonic acid-amido synthetase JAR1-like n=1 Tax=Tarenaya hassleriana TaxID=28532 RepID=UPI00053C3F42|nr:PREDICTED: jasmonic acid-amido synthetase JAR1-like [Tarenaya hassleriana]XP_010523789.1 PREDICTED: jasmonic acid-amido synthetase JAR1-like [Tarenaya hassleriana]XP_010523790.1 PREDICTED: jasmonic acid-amido synthetase JAR1-like [Tarenaya hassleriana]
MLEKVETLDLTKVIDEFEEMTRNAEEIQRQTLVDILEKNKSTFYLQRCGLNGSTDIDDFKAMVPLVTDHELEPYIKRIVEGDKSPILTAQPVPAISLSSGTSQGRPKFIPFTDELMENTLQLFRTAFAFRNRDFPIGYGKALQFIFSSKQYISEGGVPVGTATTNLYRNPKFKAGLQSIRSICCSPDEVIFSPDVHQALYCHLLCGILCRDEVQYVFAAFAHSLVHAFRTFEHVWEDIVADIREGVLSSRITVPSVRAAMSKLLRPNPELAELIRTKCMNLSNWYGLIPELFPNAKYLYGIMTGSMEPYVNKLRHYAGGLPLISHDYGSSEGWIGANVTPRLPPEEAVFAVVPNFGYFEFIPIAETEEALPKPVGLTEVKVGEEYEILFTNYAGMYRYRLGDVVKVMGFYNKTPQLKFICRKNLILSINIDKNTERDLQVSVEAAAKRLSEEKLEVLDFSSQVDVSSEPGHYVIYWEISGVPAMDALQECCNILDRSFLDAGYVGSRKSQNIGPLELRIVGKGTFKKVQEHYLGLGTSAGQFKMPRCVKHINIKVLQILSENVDYRFFSTAFDF